MLALSIFSLACNKSNQANSNLNTETANANSAKANANASANTAVLHASVKNTYNDNAPPHSSMRSATFVKKNGKWLIKSLIFGV